MRLKRILVLTCIIYLASFRLSGQNDCADAIVVCGNTGFQGLTATGIGIQEITNNVCFSEENNSIWLKLPILTSGKLAFTLTPDSDDIEEDFDFFLFGPNATCGNLGQSIRCSTTNPLAAGQSDNLTGMNDIETEDAEGPGELGNSFVQSLDVLAGQVYYLVIDRPVGFSDFSLQWTGTSAFESAPLIMNPPQTLQQCVSAGSQALFNLNANYNAIVGGQPNVLLTYHVNLNDALINSNAVISPPFFVANAAVQTIYARLTNTLTGCFSLTEFDLITHTGPTIAIDSYSLCDDGGDGSFSNGQTIFDLGAVTQHLMGNQTLAGLSISYFATLALATLNQGPVLPQQYYNPSPNLQNIFIRVTNASGCVLVKEIHLNVVSPPPISAVTLTQCDTEASPDGLTLFDLNLALPQLTGNHPGLSVAFYETANADPLPRFYTNTSNPQQLTATITNNATGCSSNSTVNLVGNTSAPPLMSLPAQCDLPNAATGLATFDLTAAVTLAANESAGFYLTAQDALLAQNAIGNPQAYQNQTAYSDLVYVRIDSGGHCATISSLQLLVNKLPNVLREEVAPHVCKDDPAYFVTLNAGILEGVPTDYAYQWYFEGVATGQTTYQIAVNQPGSYTVDVTLNGCTVQRYITVPASGNPVVDSVVINDLITVNNTVNVVVSPTSLGSYWYALDNPNGPFQDSAYFEQVRPGIHDLYIQDLLACGIFGPIQVNVLGVPKFFTPNDDGYSDHWNVVGVDPEKHKDATLHIFDRFGKLIGQVKATGNGWDGTYHGEPVPAADYWFTLHIADRFVKGHFALKR